MVVALATADLRIEWSTSLKDRRRVVRSIVDRLKARLNVSVAELDEPCTWQAAAVAVACVHSTEKDARAVMEHARRIVEGHEEVELVRFEVVFYH